jgi:hypothetical protein
MRTSPDIPAKIALSWTSVRKKETRKTKNDMEKIDGKRTWKQIPDREHCAEGCTGQKWLEDPHRSSLRHWT